MTSVYPNSVRLHHRPAHLSFGIKGKRRGQGRAVPRSLTALGSDGLPRNEAVATGGLVALAEADRLVAVNLLTPMRLIRATLPKMIARDPTELADRAGVPQEYVERLLELGIVAAGDDGTFSDGM